MDPTTREKFLHELERRSPRIPAEYEAIRTASDDEIAALLEINPTLEVGPYRDEE